MTRKTHGLTRPLIGALIGIAAHTSHATAQEEISRATTESDPIAEATAWMQEQPDVRLNAAALVSPVSSSDRARTIILDLIRRTTDGPAMLWLAHACRASGLQRECIDEGLDAAIVEYDGGNLYSRMALHQENDLARLIVETERESMYYFTLIESWYRALSAVDAEFDNASPGQRLAQAYAIAAAWSTPSFSLLVEACGSALRGGNLLQACELLADRLINAPESMLSSMMGRAILRRSERISQSDREALRRISDRASCQMQALQPQIDAMDHEAVLRFLADLKRRGEIEAWNQLAEDYAIDCSNPIAGEERKFREQAEFDAAAARLAQSMLESDHERTRAAGLIYLLTTPSTFESQSDMLLDELERLIAESSDGAVLAWLANACRSIGFEPLCLQSGLDSAIVEHDDGNLYSRAALLDRGSLLHTIKDKHVPLRAYRHELAATWVSELKSIAEELQMDVPQDWLAGAFAAGRGLGWPAMDPLTSACTSVTDDQARDCKRLAERLVREGRSSFEKLGGVRILHSVAERQGDDTEADRLLDAARRAYRASDCIDLAEWNSNRLMTAAQVDHWLTERIENGAWDVLNEVVPGLNPDCPALPSIGEFLAGADEGLNP